MAGPVEQVGEIGPCPRCGADVMTKTTIPVLGADGTGVDHICTTCARALVAVASAPPEAPPTEA